jgi:hypothetical protein
MKARHLDILWLIAFSALTLWMCGAFGAELPDFTRLPGHGVQGQCLPFSQAAATRLRITGTSAVQVLYKFSRVGTGTTWHAAVLFKHEGKLFFMDNQHTRPIRVAAKTDLGCISHVYDGSFFIHMTDCTGRRVDPKPMSALLP